MAFLAESLGLSDSAFILLRDLIHERTGLFYENGKSDLLTDKLSPLVIERGFSSFLDYYYLLKYDSESGDEWKRVMNALSVQETYLWREMDQIRALVDIVVPRYFAQQSNRPLRIWSAACAGGEEPLSIAIALNEAGWLAREPIEIYASDASASAIDRARRGVFRERSFRALPIDLREKYFVENAAEWRVTPALHSRIKWNTVNLVEESEVKPMAAVPVIFCRNVFIYFSEKSIRRTVQLFAERMLDPAYLFIGAAESLLRIASCFEFREIGDAFVYVRN